MSDIRTKRATKDFARANGPLPKGVKELELVDNSAFRWRCVVEPPATSLYAGHLYTVFLNIPDAYPNEQPNFQFAHPIFNPAVANDGKVCNNIVKDWKPDQTAGSSIEALIDVVFTNFAEVPPINEEARNLYDKDYNKFASRVKKLLKALP